MIDKIIQDIEIFFLRDIADINAAADAFMSGKITVIKVGQVYSLIVNPYIAGLTDHLFVLKERVAGQKMSVVCSYEQAKKIVDRDRVNEDFFRLPKDFFSKVIVRIPVDPTLTLPFPYNEDNNTVQFLSFEYGHPLRSIFKEELARRGCEYISITSGNIHGAPTVEDFESARVLTAVFNLKALSIETPTIQTILVDIPGDKGHNSGSYIIVSFCKKEAIEVKRLANKSDREVTEKYLAELLAGVDLQTPLMYTLP